MSSKFSEIQPWTMELAALKSLKKIPYEDMHKSLDEFEIWPDPTTGFHGNR